MDQIKIGKFIAATRVAKKLTQDELAEKIGVTDKAISKWENGRCLPDVSLFKPLCKTLGISVNELLNGEKDTNEDGYINYIKETNKKNKLKLILTILVSTTILILLLLGIYFLNNFGKTTVYKLYGTSDNFTYREGLLTVSNEKYILSTGVVEYANETLEDAKLLSIQMKYNNSIIYSGNLRKGNTILVEETGYNEIFSKEKMDNIDKWVIEITYFVNDEIHEEIIKIEKEELLKTDKFISLKSIPIGRDEFQKKEDDTSIDSKDPVAYRDALLADGFKKTDNPMIVEKRIDDSLYEVDWYAKQIRYTYKDKENTTINTIFDDYGHTISFTGYYKKTRYIYSYDYELYTEECSSIASCPPNMWEHAQEQHKIFKEILNK